MDARSSHLDADGAAVHIVSILADRRVQAETVQRCFVESNSILVPTRPGSVVSWEARVCFRPGARQHELIHC
jgi:hypothetical protein